MTALAILLALLLDQLLGEPRRLHPLIGFGRWASALEQRLNRESTSALSVARGAGTWVLAVLPVLLPLLLIYFTMTDFRWLLDVLMGYFCIARRSLREHVSAVHGALINGDLPAARAAVGRIVSRETAGLDALGVRKAAIESALENGSDAIFAPLFWLAVGGAPAVVLHRLVNTLDAMWGYRNARYCYFGRVAARADDVLNWLPARLTAASFVLLGRLGTALRAWRTQAPACASPNAGPVMAAGAGALGVEVGGAAVYHGQVEDRPRLGFGPAPQDRDIPRALWLLDATLMLWCSLLGLGCLIWHYAYG